MEEMHRAMYGGWGWKVGGLVQSFYSLSCPAICPAPPGGFTDLQVISIRHSKHSRDFKGLGSSVPKTRKKDQNKLFFIFLITYPNPQLSPITHVVYQRNRVKKEQGETSRKGSDSQT